MPAARCHQFGIDVRGRHGGAHSDARRSPSSGAWIRLVEVTDDEIAEAIRVLYSDTHTLAEGAGAAASRPDRGARRDAGKRVAMVVSGQNIDRPLDGNRCSPDPQSAPRRLGEAGTRPGVRRSARETAAGILRPAINAVPHACFSIHSDCRQLRIVLIQLIPQANFQLFATRILGRSRARHPTTFLNNTVQEDPCSTAPCLALCGAAHAARRLRQAR
jgi:hypothetical protein